MTTREVLIDSESIHKRVTELGKEISRDYNNNRLVLIGVLNGSFIFLADLVRAIDLQMEIDFIRVASYGNETSSSGSIRLTKEVELDLTGKDILLIEDIVDTGTTVSWLRRYFDSHHAGSVKVCCLVDKQERRETSVGIDYCGFTIKEGFLVGYGLDYAEKFRNLPAIYTLSP